MKILGKEIEIDWDVEFGLLEDALEKPDDLKSIKKFLKRITGLTEAEIRKLKQSEQELILLEFFKIQKKHQKDFKKKLSLI